ncbi:MlaE family ABC transporter permease [Aeromicrobium sp. P5_D10]
MSGDKSGSGTSVLRFVAAPAKQVATMGEQLAFHASAYRRIPKAMVDYRKEVVRLLAEVSLGSGALALIGGTVLVVGFLTAAAGIEVGLQAYTTFGKIGVSSLSGFFSAYFNTREVAPIIAGIALTSTVGAGFTAQLGAMRVGEEIDALEVMAVPSVTYLVSTRIVAGLLAVIPLFAVAVFMTFLATKLVVTVGYGQATGTYDHYFQTFLIPGDIFLAMLKTLIMAMVITSVCCYHGYRASGGPAGVGRAVGVAVRTTLVAIMLVDLAFGLAFWGGPSVHITG